MVAKRLADVCDGVRFLSISRARRPPRQRACVPDRRHGAHCDINAHAGLSNAICNMADYKHFEIVQTQISNALVFELMEVEEMKIITSSW